MKIEFKKKLPITIATIITSILTVVFASLSINNSNIYEFRILTQGSLCLTTFLSGLNCFVYQKQKVLAIFIWLISIFLLFVTVDTIITSVGI
ncbi:hypothetical protein [Clostridium gasigenes]|uniref:Uncharacterized protein n=1 Tax=Clostridium gasigenes TaxID=94869 RepID=A0A7X0VT61_9CLOT|nr:hypothetical protein [Clostridium gasigenes]MBB6715261.1 hypothetical protein [Clostridium gasigenes]